MFDFRNDSHCNDQNQKAKKKKDQRIYIMYS